MPALPTLQQTDGLPSSPLVSVLVPIYNVKAYLLDALRSIAHQTYPNLEIIVVDDCSTDGTYELACEFAEQDPRFKVHRNESNRRIAETLNRALHHATGNYIARCDGDDIMESDRIQRQYEYLQKHASIALVGCSFRTIDERGQYLRDVIYPGGNELIVKLLPYCSPVSHIWLAHREVYDTVGGYRISSVEDYDFLLRANLAGFSLDNIENYFGMKIRIRTDNTVSQYGIIQRRLFNYAKLVNKMERFGNRMFYSKDMENRIKEKYSVGFLSRLHYYSDKLSNRATNSNRKFLRYLWHFAASLCSPFKLQYYYYATRSTIIKAIEKTNTHRVY